MLPERWRKSGRVMRTSRREFLLLAAAAAVLFGALLVWPREAVETSSPWQTAAVMPPIESRDDVATEVLATQWIANDLSLAEAVNR